MSIDEIVKYENKMHQKIQIKMKCKYYLPDNSAK